MTGTKAYTAGRIFTGEEWLDDHLVITGNDRITSIIPRSDYSGDITVQSFAGHFIAPAFVDLQIYGAHGKLLAVYPEADSLKKLDAYCRAGGATYCLPTVATNTYDVFYKSIDAIRNYWEAGGTGVLGLHIEGPWINKVRRGAHIESMIHAPTKETVSKLLDYGRDVIRMITLAPEQCDPAIIEMLLKHGVVISAGHSDASYEEGIHAFDNGIRTATHLFNAMSPLQHRKPGLVGAIMDHKTAAASIIPDGYHVDWAAVRIAKKVLSERLFVITDAVTETAEDPYPHTLAGDKYESSGILSGSALTMSKAAQNLVRHAGIDKEEALRMCSLYPARVIGLDKVLGKIEPDYSTNFVVLDQDLNATQVVYGAVSL